MTTRALDHSYGVAVLGRGAKYQWKHFREEVDSRLADLGVQPGAIEWLDAATVDARSPKLPTVGVYFGSIDEPSADVDAVKTLLGRSAVVIPVVQDLDEFRASVPEELYPINGLKGEAGLVQVVSAVLENLGLLRKARRLFISYHRTESRKQALQLREELDARGYDVFLDTHSVPRGDPFQAVLWHRLADSDVALVLDTPDFLISRWTREEIAQAQAMTVGMEQVIWPGRMPAPYAALCEQTYLEAGDFRKRGGGLKASTVRRIADRVERLRARSLAARHDNIVREYCDSAAAIGIAAVAQPDRVITAVVNGRQVVAIPAVGVVDAARYHEASVRFLSKSPPPDHVILLYDHRGLRSEWAQFLDWLDEFLPVKAIRVTDVGARLGSLS